MKKSKHSIGTIVGNIVGGLILTGLSVIALALFILWGIEIHS